MAKYDLEIRKRGSGYVFTHRSKKIFVKTSSVDRGFSKCCSDGSFGAFEKAAELQKTLKDSYEKDRSFSGKPQHRALWEKYNREKKKRTDSLTEGLESIRAEQSAAYKDIREATQKRILEVQKDILLSRQQKYRLVKLIRTQFKAECDVINAFAKEGRANLYKSNGKQSWKGWQKKVLDKQVGIGL